MHQVVLQLPQRVEAHEGVRAGDVAEELEQRQKMVRKAVVPVADAFVEGAVAAIEQVDGELDGAHAEVIPRAGFGHFVVERHGRAPEPAQVDIGVVLLPLDALPLRMVVVHAAPLQDELIADGAAIRGAELVEEGIVGDSAAHQQRACMEVGVPGGAVSAPVRVFADAEQRALGVFGVEVTAGGEPVGGQFGKHVAGATGVALRARRFGLVRFLGARLPQRVRNGLRAQAPQRAVAEQPRAREVFADGLRRLPLERQPRFLPPAPNFFRQARGGLPGFGSRGGAGGQGSQPASSGQHLTGACRRCSRSPPSSA